LKRCSLVDDKDVFTVYDKVFPFMSIYR